MTVGRFSGSDRVVTYPRGLFNRQIPVLLRDLDAAAVDTDVVVRRVGLGSQFANGGAVHRDAPVEHQLLARAPGGDAGLRQDFL